MLKKIIRISNESHSVTESETQNQSWSYISKTWIASKKQVHCYLICNLIDGLWLTDNKNNNNNDVYHVFSTKHNLLMKVRTMNIY